MSGFCYTAAHACRRSEQWPTAQSLQTCLLKGIGLDDWRQEVSHVTRLCQHRLGQAARGHKVPEYGKSCAIIRFNFSAVLGNCLRINSLILVD